MYKIKRNGIIPNQQPLGTGKYPFLSMEVGDSFIVPKSDPTPKAAIQRSASRYSIDYNRRYKTYTLADGRVMVKRIA